jgi:hypothetical protein
MKNGIQLKALKPGYGRPRLPKEEREQRIQDRKERRERARKNSYII